MLSHRINEIIKLHAPNYSVADVAPDTFESLRGHGASNLVVWSGGSDQTIYGAPKINWAFRAWHDSIHLKYGLEFTLADEITVAEIQARQCGSDLMGDVIIAEVKGQAEYFAKYGVFPVDQTEFIKQYLNNGGI